MTYPCPLRDFGGECFVFFFFFVVNNDNISCMVKSTRSLLGKGL